MATYSSTSRTNYCKFKLEALRAFIERVSGECSFYVWPKYGKSLTKEVIDAAVATRREELQKKVDAANEKIRNENEVVHGQRMANMQDENVYDTKYPLQKEVAVKTDYEIKRELFPETMMTSIDLPETAAAHLELVAFGFNEGLPYVMLENEEEEEDYEDEEVDFLYELSLCLQEGQILVYQESGAEKMRYVAGISIAINHKGESLSVDINSIYQQAAEKFGVDEKEITLAQY